MMRGLRCAWLKSSKTISSFGSKFTCCLLNALEKGAQAGPLLLISGFAGNDLDPSSAGNMKNTHLLHDLDNGGFSSLAITSLSVYGSTHAVLTNGQEAQLFKLKPAKFIKTLQRKQ
ncbi:hypothetical protein HDU91_003931, partial [Kappamyces sp. JEL0680]